MRRKKFSYIYIGRENNLFKKARKDWGRKTEIRKVDNNKIGIWKIMFACGKELLPVRNCKSVSLLLSSGFCKDVILQRPMVKITQFLCPMFTSNNFARRKVETSSTFRQANFSMRERFSLEIFFLRMCRRDFFRRTLQKSVSRDWPLVLFVAMLIWVIVLFRL